jgi:ribosomal protein S18 acetylase RimI-like enzyme
MSAYPYRRELDCVVEAPDGSFAANCLVWLDEENRVGELEPVGTDPRFRRRGLAAAVCTYAVSQLREHGAATAVVYARGDPAYPAPRKLYESIGFRQYASSVSFVR